MYGRYYRRYNRSGRYSVSRKKFTRRSARRQSFRGRRNYRRW